MDDPCVAISLLNFHGLQDTLECLESLFEMEYLKYSLIVVDNNSHSEEADAIEKSMAGFFRERSERADLSLDSCQVIQFTQPAREPYPSSGLPEAFLLRSATNLGFCGGNNLAIEFAFAQSEPDYVLTLNNDVVVEPDFLSRLVDFAEANGGGAAFQPCIRKKGEEGVIDSLGQVVFTNGRARDKAQGAEDIGDAGSQEVFGVCAAAGLYRASALKQVGLFDERFFVSLEDVDLAWRLRMSGHAAFCVTSAVVHHGRGITGRKSLKDGINLIRSYNKNKNHLFLMLKYYPARLLFCHSLLNAYRFVSALVAGLLLRKNLLAMLPGVWRERKSLMLCEPGGRGVWKEWLERDG